MPIGPFVFLLTQDKEQLAAADSISARPPDQPPFRKLARWLLAPLQCGQLVGNQWRVPNEQRSRICKKDACMVDTASTSITSTEHSPHRFFTR